MEHKKIYNSNPEGEESSASFKGVSVNISAGEEFNFIVQTSYFTELILKIMREEKRFMILCHIYITTMILIMQLKRH